MATAIYNNPEWIGKKINKLTIIGIEKQKSWNKKMMWYWKVKCECGNEKIVFPKYVVDGKTKSCGCYQKEEVTKHGKSGTRLYKIWADMKIRCNPNNSKAKGYGDRGICVCEEWGKYELFEKWAIENGYNDHLTIERIDVNGNYSPENCKWIPRGEQVWNRRNTIHVKYEGRSMSLSEACKIAGIPYMIVFNRIYKYGWSVEKALSVR